MKKVLCMILAVIMICSMTACGTAPAESSRPTEGERPTVDSQPKNETTPTEQQPTQAQVQNNVLQIPSRDIYFTYPEGWYVEKEIYTLALMESDECLVGICYDWSTPFDGNLESLISFYSDGFLWDISSHSKGYLRTSTIEVVSSEKSTIAGYDCVRFVGKVSNNDRWDCHVYGYTFVVDDVTLMVIGLVSTQAQDADMIAEIDALTDQIAGSVRTEK